MKHRVNTTARWLPHPELARVNPQLASPWRRGWPGFTSSATPSPFTINRSQTLFVYGLAPATQGRLCPGQSRGRTERQKLSIRSLTNGAIINPMVNAGAIIPPHGEGLAIAASPVSLKMFGRFVGRSVDRPCGVCIGKNRRPPQPGHCLSRAQRRHDRRTDDEHLDLTLNSVQLW